ncbi:hypothetical protein HYV91_00450 [Candidatus Wolfebacteria bacterium]|nr:hypothetical protein [Candidatus Wolfebacteria bacterium]
MSKKLIIFSAAAFALLGLGYLFWGKERSATLRFLDFDRESITHPSSFLEKISDLSRGVKEKLSAVVEQGKSFVEKGASEASQAAKEKTYEAIEGGLEKTGEAAQNVLGVGDRPLPNEIIEYFRYLGKVGSPLSFLIKNPSVANDAQKLNYEIDWGEGGASAGSLESGKNTTISHVWQKEGEYPIKFKIALGETAEYNYEIKILILK